ncbi:MULTISPECIES: hypothetical protein [unclassified Tolypothrix]|uniref:hypothetical protein n=1 Tax=unclassified Tolypothrix TaxID=2649714 RepID=UPI0005EAC4AD|nr:MULTISPECIES: hypothetical protein [unclassified Tolypothrix]EKE99438.1 CysQ [Tolypothrix sp. PCC 7601]MBE9080799.1 hypothetical protein [Tolypothrix sp. LEGE 11397]UYD27334.1 hypothetical protein HGR01_04340 [Tolypothrix sp. PCC 7712]UYD36804.1 hypothetical protein HG267_14390 [Tolypothrix sp. PCC 7601]
MNSFYNSHLCTSLWIRTGDRSQPSLQNAIALLLFKTTDAVVKIACCIYEHN